MKKRKNSAGRRFIRSRWHVFLVLFLQMVFLGYILISGSRISQAVLYALTAVSILSCLVILSGKGENAYKLTWIFWILVLPIFGGFFYMVLQSQWSKKSFTRRAAEAEKRSKEHAKLPEEYVLSGEALAKEGKPVMRYLSEHVGYPTYRTDEVTFFSSGEEMHDALLAALSRAEKYIFLEYFIIEEGEMWHSILNILEEKAKAGVLVRVLYDDVGCFTHLPRHYHKRLRAMGIEAAAFHPFVSLFSIEQNNRDHRKIAVVDGHTAFTGGVNIADEYVNKVEKFGHWKDAACLVRGGGAWSFTLMFLEMWELSEKTKEDLSAFRTALPLPSSLSCGLVTPYADSPMDNEHVGENVYLSLIRTARKYVYITTPYLIISDTMQNALTLAAKSGVDVRIITPGKWDKRIVHTVTRSYYRDLVDAGVKVYEYTPGFLHAKTLVSDDAVGTVGSVNFDYRSLYLHFECGTVIAEREAVLRMKEDFLQTLAKCAAVSPVERRGESILFRLWQAVLRLLAPLL